MAAAGPEVIAEKLLALAEPITALRPDPRNARKHNEKNLAAVRSSLTRFGQVKPIVVDADGVVLAGNGTLEAAKALGWKRLAVVRVPLTGADARAYALADNRTAELAEWDWEELAAQTRELGIDALQDVGWDTGDLEGLLALDNPAKGVLMDLQALPPDVRAVTPMLPGGVAPPVGAPAGEFKGGVLLERSSEISAAAPPSTVKMVPLFFAPDDAADFDKLSRALCAFNKVESPSLLVLGLLRGAAETL